MYTCRFCICILETCSSLCCASRRRSSELPNETRALSRARTTQLRLLLESLVGGTFHARRLEIRFALPDRSTRANSYLIVLGFNFRPRCPTIPMIWPLELLFAVFISRPFLAPKSERGRVPSRETRSRSAFVARFAACVSRIEDHQAP